MAAADEVLQLDFEGVEPVDDDVPSMSKLLNQLVKESGIDPEQLARVLVSQNYVGNVLKPCIDDVDCDEDEDPEDQPVFAITSLINVSVRDEIPVLVFQEFLRERLTAEPVSQVKKTPTCFDEFKVQYGLSQENYHVGWLVKERMVNLPFQYLLPSLESLMTDLTRANKLGMKYSCQKMIYWTKMYIQNGQYYHVDIEDGWFDDNCYGYFDYPLKNADTVMVRDGDDAVGIPIRRVYMFDGAKLKSFVSHVQEITTGV